MQLLACAAQKFELRAASDLDRVAKKKLTKSEQIGLRMSNL